MNVDDVREKFEHPAWTTAVATAISYGLILGLMTLLLFVVPMLIFSSL
jgi:hypothetical protein